MVGLGLIAAAKAIGAAIGIWRARSVVMTGMLELIAMLHSSSVWLPYRSGRNSSYDTNVPHLGIHDGEVFVGVFIGAVTSTGSIVAYLKLAGMINSAPKMLPAHNAVNLGIIPVFFGMTAVYTVVPRDDTMLRQSLPAVMTVLALFLGWHLVSSIGGGDTPVVVPVFNSLFR